MRWLCVLLVGAFGFGCSSRSSKEQVPADHGGAAGASNVTGGSAGSGASTAGNMNAGGTGTTSGGSAGSDAVGGSAGTSNSAGGTAGTNAVGGGAGAGGSAGALGCTPVGETGPLLFGAQTAPSVIAVDTSYVYWINATATGLDLQRGPKAGGCPETLRSKAFVASADVKDIFVDRDALFVASTEKSRALVKFNKETGEDLFKAECASAGTGVAAQNEKFMYYGCTEGNGKIAGVSKDTLENSMTWDSPAATLISGMAATTSFVYYSFENGAVENIETDGGPGKTLMQDAPFIRVAYGTKLWALAGTSVWSLAEGAGGVRVTTLEGGLDIIATSDTAFILQQSAEGKTSVLRLSPTKTYELDVEDPGGFALDGTHLYVTDERRGTISRVAR